MKTVVLKISQMCMALISVAIVYSVFKLFIDNDFTVGVFCGTISTSIIFLTNTYFKTPNQNG